jgi:hypothetical protein
MAGRAVLPRFSVSADSDHSALEKKPSKDSLMVLRNIQALLRTDAFCFYNGAFPRKAIVKTAAKDDSNKPVEGC